IDQAGHNALQLCLSSRKRRNPDRSAALPVSPYCHRRAARFSLAPTVNRSSLKGDAAGAVPVCRESFVRRRLNRTKTVAERGPRYNLLTHLEVRQVSASL